MKWSIGDIGVVSIVEQDLTDIEQLIPGATREVVDTVDWLAPHFIDNAGTLTGIIQAFVLETPSHKIVVDTCVGNDKQLSALPQWHKKQHAFMSRLNEAGHTPAEIDVVLCTHMHMDHVGWNTCFDGESWQPTFPNARYLFAEDEYQTFMAAIARDPLRFDETSTQEDQVAAIFDVSNREISAESIRPIIDAGLHELVATDAVVCDGVRLIPTHGHTAGHVSVVLASQGREAIITGDAIHHPVQIARPELYTIADATPEAAIATRRDILRDAEESGRLLIGTHFSEPTAGFVEKDGDTYQFRTAR